MTNQIRKYLSTKNEIGKIKIVFLVFFFFWLGFEFPSQFLSLLGVCLPVGLHHDSYVYFIFRLIFYNFYFLIVCLITVWCSSGLMQNLCSKLFADVESKRSWFLSREGSSQNFPVLVYLFEKYIYNDNIVRFI